MPSAPRKSDYHVGWISAVTVEHVAACEMLDEEYRAPCGQSIRDNNVYTFGRIGHHYIVLACLPKGIYGVTSAAVVATDLRRSFPGIRYGLMVGIGGGAPSPRNDIRLGDVVVSIPTGQRGGVLHYDFGKTIQNKKFEPTGSLNAPPRVLLSGVEYLARTHQQRGHQINENINRMIAQNPRLHQDFQRPSESDDVLYRSDVVHVDKRKSCRKGCPSPERFGQGRPYHRPQGTGPVIHHGLIASANRLMKDSFVRDRLAEKENVLCFEMEAAGLMDHFPCLVIRGICDYSDTHKNDLWQGYAAAAAAAYAKELLQIPVLAPGSLNRDVR